MHIRLFLREHQYSPVPGELNAHENAPARACLPSLAQTAAGVLAFWLAMEGNIGVTAETASNAALPRQAVKTSASCRTEAALTLPSPRTRCWDRAGDRSDR